MLKFARGVTKHRKIILIISVLLLIPSALGFMGTRINYDLLSYLPDSIETVKGQDIMLDNFGKGGYALIVVDGMENKDIVNMKEKMEDVNHVESVLWYDTVADISVPMDILPDDVTEAFNNGDCTLMAAFFDTGTSADESLNALTELRQICGKQCYISSMTAFVEDVKELIDQEMPIYVLLAVVLSGILLTIFMDSFFIPVIFLSGIGMEIIFNMGSNIFKGEISYLTMAVAAVLQLAVTMDYSIFLWSSYKEQKSLGLKREEAMSQAIAKTLVSITGSSITTIAGFLALCFMTFTLGMDMGIVMAKGVLIGIVGSVTILPSMILALEKWIDRTTHRQIMPDFGKLTDFILRNPKKMLIIFIVLLIPSLYGYMNAEEYYKLDASVPQTLPFAVANEKLESEFDMATSYMIIADSNTKAKDMANMIDEISNVDGVDLCLGLDSVTGGVIPKQILPNQVTDTLANDKWQVLMVTSKYELASDEVNNQITVINNIMDKYDKKAMLIGEAPCTKDMIDITAHDFKVVNFVSILAILVIIFFVLQSVSLPVILVAIIELAIFINLGIPCYTGTKLAFICGVIISTVQLGSTVDYAILMTTRYKTERLSGKDARESVRIAHTTSMPSIVVSALAFFAATLGVGIYSDVDMVGQLCILMARGAIVSMFIVCFMLPSALLTFDKIVIKTSRGMRGLTHGLVTEQGVFEDMIIEEEKKEGGNANEESNDK